MNNDQLGCLIMAILLQRDSEHGYISDDRVAEVEKLAIRIMRKWTETDL